MDDLQFEAKRNAIEVIKEIGFWGYKTLITLNAGAFVVMLTFVANAGENNEFDLKAEYLKLAMFAFIAGIALTFVSATIAYIQSQLNLLGSALPGGRSTTGHMLWILMPVVMAFLAFLMGGTLAIFGITPR